MTSDLHLTDELSALLDGELPGEERAAAEAHVASCDQCRAELDATRLVRDRVRGAPAVEPPFGFYERLTSKRRRWPTVASAVAIAAACVLLVGFVVRPGPATRTPPVGALRAVASGNTENSGLDLHRVDRSSRLPDQLAGLPKRSTFKAFVERENADVSVFAGQGADTATGAPPTIVAYVIDGKVDWSKLQGGIRKPVDGLPGDPWQSIASGQLPALAVQSGGTTVVLTGNVPESTLVEAARQIAPASSPSAVDRLRDAAETLVDGFSLH
jgi:anti-sigma factor RsiW